MEKEHLLNYYNETIEDRIEDGMSEAEAVSKSGFRWRYREADIQRARCIVQRGKARTQSAKMEIAVVWSCCYPFWATLLCVFAMIYLLLWTLILRCLIVSPEVCWHLPALSLEAFESDSNLKANAAPDSSCSALSFFASDCFRCAEASGGSIIWLWRWDGHLDRR